MPCAPFSKQSANVQEQKRRWRTLTFAVDSVCLLSRAGFLDPFVVRYVIPLGATGPPREVNAAYVATLGPGPPPARGPLVRSNEICYLDLAHGHVHEHAMWHAR
jgi:hypothetical protein